MKKMAAEQQELVGIKTWATGTLFVTSLVCVSSFMGYAFRLSIEQASKEVVSKVPKRTTANNGLAMTINHPPMDHFLQKALSIDPETQGYLASSWSDTAYLDHCNFKDADWNEAYDFIATAMPRNFNLPNDVHQKKALKQELKLELLEIYAANHTNLCDFHYYAPSVRLEAKPELIAAMLRRVPPSDEGLARLAIAIVAYKDLEHLIQLIRGVYMPHHYIIIHLERLPDPEFERGVREYAMEFKNVVVLKFGSVVYKTGEVTDINLRIMRWIVFESGLHFSYFLTLGGAVYPLYSARDLTVALQHSGRKVFMGEINNAYAQDIAQDLFGKIGLTYSRREVKKYPLRPSQNRSQLGVPLRPELMKLFDRKSNSGNQAVFHYDTLKSLLESADAMEIMAYSKYACCCCLEELVWYGAMNAIGLRNEALYFGSVIQFWSGLPKCEYTMSNAVLKVDKEACYLLGDRNARRAWNVSKEEVQGMYLKDILVKAKGSGFLFARKFDSNNPGSVEMRTWIQETLHPKRIGPYLTKDEVVPFLKDQRAGGPINKEKPAMKEKSRTKKKKRKSSRKRDEWD
jgi:hypothetical protein